MKEEKPFYEVMREIDEVCGEPVGKSPVQIFEEGRKEGIVDERNRMIIMLRKRMPSMPETDFDKGVYTELQYLLQKLLTKEGE